MRSKHTPGPWRIFPHGHSTFYVHSVDPLKARIATISGTDGAHSIHEANARLIGLAPEMFDALKRLTAYIGALHGHDDSIAAYEVGRAIITRAEQDHG